jgi:hypothetical protein
LETVAEAIGLLDTQQRKDKRRVYKGKMVELDDSKVPLFDPRLD